MKKSLFNFVAFMMLLMVMVGCDTECSEGQEDQKSTTTTTIRYKVSFDANGGSGSMETISLYNGEIRELPTCTLTPPVGYKFTWWNTKKDGSGDIYEDKSEIMDLAKSFGVTVKLFAQWVEIESHSIMYNNLCGIDNSMNPKTFKEKDDVLILPLARIGYTFNGWFDAENGGNKVEGWSAGAKITDVTLWARWTVNTYTIEYKDQNNETFSGEHESGYPTTHAYDTETTLDTPTREGYEFAGWFDNADCTGDVRTTIGETEITEDITLYAKWNHANVHTITVVTPVYEDIGGLVSYDSGTTTFTALSDYQSYKWIIDGVKQTNITNTFTVAVDELTAGWHNVSLQVTDSNGTRYSAEYDFEVRKIR